MLHLENKNIYQFLFLGGILGEVLEKKYIGNYLKENCDLFKENGINNTTYKTLPSKRSAKDNSIILLSLIEKLVRKTTKKIIIFAHSKACLEVLLALKADHELFKKSVHKIILTQPPLKGAPYFKSYHSKILDRVWPGFSCLTQNYYKEDIQDVLIKNPKYESYIEENLLIIKGYKENFKNVSWIIKLPYSLCRSLGDHSDGLVRIQDQEIEIEKYNSILLQLDHSDLYCSNRLSNLSKASRKEVFTKLLDWAINNKHICINSMPKEVQFNEINEAPLLFKHLGSHKA